MVLNHVIWFQRPAPYLTAPRVNFLAGLVGFEPTTLGFGDPCSANWNYRPTNSWSEYKDSNLGPPAPKAGALPNCATLRTNWMRVQDSHLGCSWLMRPECWLHYPQYIYLSLNGASGRNRAFFFGVSCRYSTIKLQRQLLFATNHEDHQT